MEVANLKPSLAWKLNHMGLSPLHIALQHECMKMVRGLITLNTQLIRVKAKGMITPLHYLAQIEDPDLLAEFFLPVHLLVGWLRRADKDDVLNWKDEDGNTALHIAAVKTLIKNANVNVKNLDDHLRELTLIDKRDKYFGFNTQNKHNDIRTVVLVVAILIATASYQAGLSPPVGYWQDDYKAQANNGSNNGNSTSLEQGQRAHRAGQMMMNPSDLVSFFILNGLAFYLSVWTILVIIIGLPLSGALYTSTSLLLYGYYASMEATFPTEGSVGLTVGSCSRAFRVEYQVARFGSLKTRVELESSPFDPSIYRALIESISNNSRSVSSFLPLNMPFLLLSIPKSLPENGAGISASVAAVEDSTPVGSKGAAMSMTSGAAVEVLSKFEDPKWIWGTWDLKQFKKDGTTDGDAVIDAETTSNDDPVVFDTSIIPWWAWMKRFHLPEAELLNGREAL
ncbi:2-dehydro-3-deoxyphosphoheptonate aldolase/ 3-deoxy-d-arabino-heptulosonate 7-phosphate synthetase [Hibiscus syriacus]|uniref:2-dehydro-3-deoxyphosphoheptonate aldolase/ 3-deoxy-d-arabino-heptulosonate 7-phosphate synthetase n=1 Tax=Hibiscus syriacus TaxID=106335 RepID=A0A6A2YX23_HIBSY|nr:2-dehydro-3-deoxyphosphoheptonate aldolase/ 3-deoxy-d-arabino-heptulosonate 7-phosphate synthetase [Hibiscus syriacus]